MFGRVIRKGDKSHDLSPPDKSQNLFCLTNGIYYIFNFRKSLTCSVSYGYAVLRLYGYAEYSVSSVKAKRPYNHITLIPKKLKLAKLQLYFYFAHKYNNGMTDEGEEHIFGVMGSSWFSAFGFRLLVFYWNVSQWRVSQELRQTQPKTNNQALQSLLLVSHDVKHHLICSVHALRTYPRHVVDGAVNVVLDKSLDARDILVLYGKHC